MKILNFAIAVFSVIFGFFGVIAGMILPACERIAVFGIAVRQRTRIVGIAVAMILMVGVTASALAVIGVYPTRHHPPSNQPPPQQPPPKPLPQPTTAVNIEQLNAYDSAAAAPPNPYRLGNSRLTITETQYSDNNGNPQVIVSSLRFARAGMWLDDNGEYQMEVFADNLVRGLPPPYRRIGQAVYLIEGEALYKGARYYPDGYVQADFDTVKFVGRFSAVGDDADDDFGPNAELPDGSGGMRSVMPEDKFVVDLSGSLRDIQPGSGDLARFHLNDGANVAEASGFFAGFRVGSQVDFRGAFHHYANYDRSLAPAELSGRFSASDSAGEVTEGWLLGGRPLPFPDISDTVTLDDLYAADPSARTPTNAFRKGGSGFYPIVERKYRDTRILQVVVQSLQYANLGVWVNGDLSAVDNFEYASLADKFVAPPDKSNDAGEATYIIEGDAVYEGIRFYPDGYLNANFVAATISGQISISGKDAADDFGDANAMLPDGNGGTQPVTTDDILVMDLLSGPIAQDDGFGFKIGINIAEASGFFARFRTGDNDGNLYGRFYDDRHYTGEPAEVAGDFVAYETRSRRPIRGGFLGKRRVPLPVPSATVTVTLGDLEEYDSAPTSPDAKVKRKGARYDADFEFRQRFSIDELQFKDIVENKPQVLVQMLEHAYLGIWMYGDPSAVGNFEYASLDNNVVTPPTPKHKIGRATYDIEGEAVYKGVRFYPDGYLNANFNNGTIRGLISVYGDQPNDDFGAPAAELLADDGVGSDAVLEIGIRNGDIESKSLAESGFKGDAIIHTAEGFFSDLEENTHYYNAIDGLFHDNVDDYDNKESPPAELSGKFKLLDIDDPNKVLMQGGFLGKRALPQGAVQ